MNGTFLLVLGAIWTEVRLSPPAKIAAAGHHGQPWQESLAAAGFLSIAVAIIAASLLVLWGLRARALRVHNDSGSQAVDTYR